eukprot:TRINITY_DN70_c0_g2_i2.p1 TRINITY_DN70_c0_g2~~TRINITY_DN70_c0_g2_i2.p1  ORF type:complete len:397 (-),score=55.59 TRINITY_DN70_c0_g2_i2:51-1241(-)
MGGNDQNSQYSYPYVIEPIPFGKWLLLSCIFPGLSLLWEVTRAAKASKEAQRCEESTFPPWWRFSLGTLLLELFIMVASFFYPFMLLWELCGLVCRHKARMFAVWDEGCPMIANCRCGRRHLCCWPEEKSRIKGPLEPAHAWMPLLELLEVCLAWPAQIWAAVNGRLGGPVFWTSLAVSLVSLFKGVYTFFVNKAVLTSGGIPLVGKESVYIGSQPEDHERAHDLHTDWDLVVPPLQEPPFLLCQPCCFMKKWLCALCHRTKKKWETVVDIHHYLSLPDEDWKDIRRLRISGFKDEDSFKDVEAGFSLANLPALPKCNVLYLENCGLRELEKFKKETVQNLEELFLSNNKNVKLETLDPYKVPNLRKIHVDKISGEARKIIEAKFKRAREQSKKKK